MRFGKSLLQSVGRDVFLEDRPDDRQVGTDPRQVAVCLREYDRQSSLGRAHIDEGLILRPGPRLRPVMADRNCSRRWGSL